MMLNHEFFVRMALEFSHLFGELLLLFVGISFTVALLQVYISPARVRQLLSTPNRGLSSILGTALGAATPFCSCSTIPVLTGLLRSGAPFCGVVSFLLASPILNPAILTLFLAFFGAKAATVYGVFTFSLAVVMGLFLDRLGFAREVKPAVIGGCGCCGCGGGGAAWENLSGTFWEKQKKAVAIAARSAGALFKSVLPYLLLGAGVGAFIHGAVPEGLLEKFAGANRLWAVPLAAVVGIPMYIRTETMIPIASILMAKGVAPGVAIALILGGAGASLPELSLLSSIFTRKMLAAFIACVFTVAIVTGYAFNFMMQA